MDIKKATELLRIFDKTSDLLSVTKQELKKFDEKYEKSSIIIPKPNGPKTSNRP
jgi:hypothetical protein